MRKLYLLMLSLIVAVAANAADWYLIGANYGNWNQSETYKFAPDSSDANIQTLHVESLSGDFKIKESSTWDTSFSTNNSKLVEGVLYKCGTNGGNIVVDGMINDATLTIDLSARTLLVTGASEENDYDTVYLVGDFGSGWSETVTSYPLTLKEGTEDTWVGTYKLTASSNYFKMKAGTLVYGTGGQDVSVVLGTPYTASQSGNAYNIGVGEYDFTFVLAKNADTGVLTVTNAGGSIEPVYPETTYVIGNVNGLGWDPTNGVALAQVSDGVYSAEVEIGTELGTDYGYFSFASTLATVAGDYSGLGQRYGSVADNTVPSLEEPNTVQKGEFSFKVEAPAKYAMTLSLVDMTLVITKVGGDEPEPVQPLEVSFDFAVKDNWFKYSELPDEPTVDSSAKANSYYEPATAVNDGVVITFEKNPAATGSVSASRYYQTGDGSAAKQLQLRFYKNNFLTVAAPEGYVLKTIAFGGAEDTSAKLTQISLKDGEKGTYTAASSTAAEWVAPEDEEISSVAFQTSGTTRIYTIAVTLAEASGDEPQPSIYVPETLYLMGNVGANAWAVNEGVELALSANVFTAEQVEVGDAGEGSGYIQFNELRGTSASDWDTVNGGYRYGAAEDNAPIVIAEGESSTELTLTTYVPNVNAMACKSFKIAAGTYDFAVNFNGEAPVLTVTKSTNAVKGISVADSEAAVEYYNLQGVRVADPANGLYIRRQGNTVTKVFVK